jgi:hypothetical protein
LTAPGRKPHLGAVDRDFAPTPWEPLPVDDHPRPRRGWKRAAALLVGLFVVLPLITFGGYSLAMSNAAGKVAFGSSSVACTLGGPTSVFTEGEPIFAAVILERGVTPGEILTIRLQEGGGTVGTFNYAVQATGNCHTKQIDNGVLGPGSYRLTYSVGEEVLAGGDFEIREAAVPSGGTSMVGTASAA